MKLRKHLLVLELLETSKKPSKSGLIVANKEIYLEDYEDHIYRGRVFSVGSCVEDYFPEGIEKGDIVYLDRNIHPVNDMFNYKGVVYAKVPVSFVILVEKEVK